MAKDQVYSDVLKSNQGQETRDGAHHTAKVHKDMGYQQPMEQQPGQSWHDYQNYQEGWKNNS